VLMKFTRSTNYYWVRSINTHFVEK